MTILVLYNSKKLLKSEIGQPLKYRETSMFGAEYRPDGVLTVAHRPHKVVDSRNFISVVRRVA
jgi:hypothetical protein